MRVCQWITMPLLLLIATGCPGNGTQLEPIPLESSQVTPALDTNMNTVAVSIEDAVKWLGDSDTMGCFGSSDPEFAATPGGEPVSPRREETAVDGLDKVASDIAEFLKEEILTDLESTDGSILTYRIDPLALFCKDEDEMGNPSTNPDCAEVFDGADITVQVVSYSAGDIDMMLIINDHQPVTVKVHKDEISVHLNLEAAKNVWELVADNFPADEKPPISVNTLKGIVAVGIRAPSTEQASVFGAVTSPISVDVTIEGEAISLNIAPSEGSLTVDRAAKTVSAAFALGQVELGVAGKLISDLMFGNECDDHAAPMRRGEEDRPFPGEPECEPTEIQGRIDVRLAGITGTLAMTDGQQEIALKGFGFGPTTSTLKLDGQEIAAFDLNASLGRTLDATLSLCNDTSQIVVLPGLDASLKLAMGPMATTYPEITGSWLENETLRVVLEGETPTLGLDPMGVITGELRLESASQPDLNLTILAGQCMDSEGDAPIRVGPSAPGSGDGSSDDESEEMPPPFDDDESSDHPFEGLIAGQCTG